MSNNRVGRDRLRAAGSGSLQNQSSTAACLTVGERPPTPPEQAKYRKSSTQPGQRVVHYGLVDDLDKQVTTRAVLPPSQQAFGSAVKDSEHVADVFAHGPQDEVAAITAAHGESRFKMTNVPIGKPRPSVGVELPERAQSADFAFGVKAPSSEAAKNLLFPEDSGEPLHPEVYTKSHGSYLPGEQSKRNYNWEQTGVDPLQHTFGKVERVTGESAAACISEKKGASTRVVSKAQVDFMTSKARHIGKPTSFGNHTQPDRTFGLPSDPKAPANGWGAGDCIRGDYGDDDDPKLGKSTKKGHRNVTTETRAFGVPTIRDDVAPPKNRSVSDSQNYGTDVHAKALLFPSQFSSIGVHDEDFAKQRPPSQIRQIFANIGQVYTDDEFTRIWWRAATAGDLNGNGIVSVKEFNDVADEFAADRDAGRRPAWWEQAGREGPAQLASDVADSLR
jgi:hypothetical protein